ncbi:MAG: DUF58 domain-containing protein [Actinobacteria bacterium]|nr:DUF58 domain-containing protein [Actinomycetota bacterium]
MRAALSALTTRGRSLLAAAVSAAGCAVLLGEKDLLRVACFLACLPLLAAVATVRTRLLLRCTRQVVPARVPVGTSAQVVLALENVSPLPSGLLLLEDGLTHGLGGRHRFVLDHLRPGRPREVRYHVRSDLRGRFRVGPLQLRMTDPFGLVALSRAFTVTDWLVVVPEVQRLDGAPTGGAWHAGETNRSTGLVAARGEDEAGTREYRRGDDLRRVHWRSTARAGTLMVRREEPPQHHTATLLLDCRRRAHEGLGAGSSLEWAVSAVASIGTHLGRLGYALRLVTDDGPTRPGLNLAEGAVLLDHLAEVELSPHHGMERASGALRTVMDARGPVIAILGAVDLADAHALAAIRPAAGAGLAVLVDTASWLSGAEPAERARTERARTDQAAPRDLLTQAGWRVVPAGRDARLAEVWSQACSGTVAAPAAANRDTSAGAGP